MTCPGDDTWIALLEYTLTAEALVALEAHVDRCATCRATVGHLAAIVYGDKRTARRRIISSRT